MAMGLMGGKMAKAGMSAGVVKSQSDVDREKELDRQKKREELRTAEAESEIKRRKALSRSGGIRASLLATSPTGISNDGLAAKTGG